MLRKDAMGEPAALKERSPLLPLRHEPDFFVCDVFDAALKGDRASMEHPVFSLSKKPDMTTRRYENGGHWCEVRPSSKGVATVFDRDVLIYCISQCIARINEGLPVARKLRFKAYDLLIATNRDTRGGGRAYKLLSEAFDRLQGTQIKTNIVTGGVEEMDTFSLIDRARVMRETRDGRMIEVEITLSDWVFNAIREKEVLTLNKRYFQLARPLERRLYELARKHVGDQSEFRISVEKLHKKTGSQSTIREFKRLLRAIIDDDAEHDHMPDYRLSIEDEMVLMQPKVQRLSSRSNTIRISPAAIEDGRKHAPGWDIYMLEREWEDWVKSKRIEVRDADAMFVSFCKRKGRYKARG